MKNSFLVALLILSFQPVYAGVLFDIRYPDKEIKTYSVDSEGVTKLIQKKWSCRAYLDKKYTYFLDCTTDEDFVSTSIICNGSEATKYQLSLLSIGPKYGKFTILSLRCE